LQCRCSQKEQRVSDACDLAHEKVPIRMRLLLCCRMLLQSTG
jgi:hypothetical protein